ncbi:MAG: hypothetical protein LBC14_07215 [Desulfovibrio sp.]|nr:hypothetical protein [Desulfovibrio sp.]
MIINIHGFTGNGDNSKYRWLTANIRNREFFSPTLDYCRRSPESILRQLHECASSYLLSRPASAPGLSILGSSLGAFFARCLNLLFPQAMTVLINPALAPFLTLREYIDCKAYLTLFAKFAYLDDDMRDTGRLHVIIGDADELIDHARMTKPLLPQGFKQYHIIRGGVHRLELTPEVGGILRSVFA